VDSLTFTKQAVGIQLLVLENCWSISTGSYLNTLLTALILLREATTWRTGWDKRASTIMKSSWTVSKRGWAHRRQASLRQVHKNLFLDVTSASVPAVTTLRSSLSMYVLFVHNNMFSLVACFVNSSPEFTFQIILLYTVTLHKFSDQFSRSKYCSQLLLPTVSNYAKNKLQTQANTKFTSRSNVLNYSLLPPLIIQVSAAGVVKEETLNDNIWLYLPWLRMEVRNENI
jgi:hypothetical protein